MDTGQEGRRPVFVEAPRESESWFGVFSPHTVDIFRNEPLLGSSPSLQVPETPWSVLPVQDGPLEILRRPEAREEPTILV